MTTKRTWSALAGAALLLAACDFTDNILIPSLTGSSTSGGDRQVIPASAAERNPQPTLSGPPPQLGQNNFQPDGVTAGQTTGTEVGRRVERLRGDLGRLQTNIGNGNQLAFFDFPGLYLGPYAEVLGSLHHLALSVEPRRWAQLKDKLNEAGIEYFHHRSSLYFPGPDNERIELISDPLGEMYGESIG